MAAIIELNNGLSRHRNARLEEAERRSRARAHAEHLRKLTAKMKKPAAPAPGASEAT